MTITWARHSLLAIDAVGVLWLGREGDILTRLGRMDDGPDVPGQYEAAYRHLRADWEGRATARTNLAPSAN